jgi:hypothetical protein
VLYRDGIPGIWQLTRTPLGKVPGVFLLDPGDDSEGVAAGLPVLQSAGIILYDVSPRDFLLGSGFHPKIAGFGDACLHVSPPSAVVETRFGYPVSD